MPHDSHEQGETGRNDNMFVESEVQERCKTFGTVTIPYIPITLKSRLLFRKENLLLYKLVCGITLKYRIARRL